MNEQARSPVERFADLMMMIRKHPRTIRDLCEVEGIRRADATVTRYVKAMHEAGHVYIVGWRDAGHGPAAAVYAWQPEPFQFEDAVREAVAA